MLFSMLIKMFFHHTFAVKDSQNGLYIQKTSHTLKITNSEEMRMVFLWQKIACKDHSLVIISQTMSITHSRIYTKIKMVLEIHLLNSGNQWQLTSKIMKMFLVMKFSTSHLLAALRKNHQLFSGKDLRTQSIYIHFIKQFLRR